MTVGILAQAPSVLTPAMSSQQVIFWITVLGLMALLPFVLTMTTAFAKLVIVGGIIRQALGTQNIPPNSVLTGLALVLTIQIMAPTAIEMYRTYERTAPAEANVTASDAETRDRLVNSIVPPLEAFMQRHASRANIALFERLSGTRTGSSTQPSALPDSLRKPLQTLTVLVPAFVLTELTEAFQIGFIIYLPFVVLDLLVSNVLMALGMQMLSPQTISLPLKLLLFVLIDGWKLIMQGLTLGYAGTGG